MCAQLGAGFTTSYPNAIDTRQIYENGSSPAPDSISRIDAELANDALAAIIAIETSLGANVQGTYGSLAARLNQFIPGSGGVPGLINFTNALTLTIPGSQHNVGQAAMLWQLYDNAIPAHAMEPGSVGIQVDPATYNVTLAFPIPISGSIALGIQSPLYLASFTNADTVVVPGNVHNLGTADLVFQLYLDDGSGTLISTEPGSLTVDVANYDVVLRFIPGLMLTGTLVLSAGGPAYATTFTNVATVTIPGSVHQLATPALLFQVYDTGTPRAAMGDPDVSVNPTTFDVTVRFGVPLSGRLVLVAVSTTTGREFDIRDGGIINQTAVRVTSETGSLLLQAGSANRIVLLDRLRQMFLAVDFTSAGFITLQASHPLHLTDGSGTLGATFVPAAQRLGLGMDPSFQLQLATDSAAKPGSGSWQVVSDAAVKQDVEPFTEGLEVLLALDPVRFHYNGLAGTPQDGTRHISLVAQAVQAVAPYLVRSHRSRLRPDAPETDLLTLDPGPLVFLLINTIKTMHAWLQDLRQGQQRLEQQVATLASAVAALSSSPEESA